MTGDEFELLAFFAQWEIEWADLAADALDRYEAAVESGYVGRVAAATEYLVVFEWFPARNWLAHPELLAD